MPPYQLRKGLSLPPLGDYVTYGDPNDFRYVYGGSDPVNNAQYSVSSNSVYIKYFVSWYRFQGEARGISSAPASAAASWAQLDACPLTASLDDLVKAANNSGRAVIITIDASYPLWSNGQTRSSAQSLGGTGARTLDRAYPDARTTDSPFGWFVSWLCHRYSSAQRANPKGAFINALEVCNEPNGLMFPQRGIWSAVADMLYTAEAYAAYWQGPSLLGPATTDAVNSDPMYVNNGEGSAATGWQAFTDQLLMTLKGWQPRVYVGWSHHNYGDIANGSINVVSYIVGGVNKSVRSLLYLHEWKGASADRAIWLTEGGYLFRGPFPVPLDQQNTAFQKMRSNFLNMEAADDIYLWTHHSITDRLTNNSFPDGMRNPPTSAEQSAGKFHGSKRVMFDAWNSSYFPGAPTV